ncbi:MAG: hypothetical protein JJW01_00870 [Alphaproteobacteria bacterium]|nr:hypothetical protein [Rickettsiales bacterium]
MDKNKSSAQYTHCELVSHFNSFFGNTIKHTIPFFIINPTEVNKNRWIFTKLQIDHKKEESSSLLPAFDDSSVMFTNSGMMQFKEYFAGSKVPLFPNVFSTQRCLRAGGKHNDLDNVGFTPRHHTFFEMLGNFSFGSFGNGSYSKVEAICIVFIFLVRILKINFKYLHFTVDEKDQESFEIWNNLLDSYILHISFCKEELFWNADLDNPFYKKIDQENFNNVLNKYKAKTPNSANVNKPEANLKTNSDAICKKSQLHKIKTKTDNWWTVGATGLCGYCTEIYYDYGIAVNGYFDDKNNTGAHGDRFIEIWNLVCMQYTKKTDGTIEELPFVSIDTGAGLERILAVLNGVDNNFNTDIFLPIINKIKEIYTNNPIKITSEIANQEQNIHNYRVIADHMRAICYIQADGILPSADGVGYVLRKIIRRACDHAISLKKAVHTKNLLHNLVDIVIQTANPDWQNLLNKSRDRIINTIQLEEEKYYQIVQTMDINIKKEVTILNSFLENTKKHQARNGLNKLLEPTGKLPEFSKDKDNNAIVCTEVTLLLDQWIKDKKLVEQFASEYKTAVNNFNHHDKEVKPNLLLALQKYEQLIFDNLEKNAPHNSGWKQLNYQLCQLFTNRNQQKNNNPHHLDNIDCLNPSNLKNTGNTICPIKYTHYAQYIALLPIRLLAVRCKDTYGIPYIDICNWLKKETNLPDWVMPRIEQTSGNLLYLVQPISVKKVTQDSVLSRIRKGEINLDEVKFGDGQESVYLFAVGKTNSAVFGFCDDTQLLCYHNNEEKIYSSLSGNFYFLHLTYQTEEECYFICEKTPFYQEGGGQFSDAGVITLTDDHTQEGMFFQPCNDNSKHIAVTCYKNRILDGKKPDLNNKLVVSGVLKINNIIFHKIKNYKLLKENNKFQKAKELSLKVDVGLSYGSQIHHSASHLVNGALRQYFGQEIIQKGSQVYPDWLRFDFLYDGAVAQMDIVQLEKIINTAIANNAKVYIQDNIPKDEAKARGAISIPNENYGQSVRVVQMGGKVYNKGNKDESLISMELCGGMHVNRTGDIGALTILQIKSIGSGIKRIEAIAGLSVYKYNAQMHALLSSVAAKYKIDLQFTLKENCSIKISDEQCNNLDNLVKNKDKTEHNPLLDYIDKLTIKNQELKKQTESQLLIMLQEEIAKIKLISHENINYAIIQSFVVNQEVPKKISGCVQKIIPPNIGVLFWVIKHKNGYILGVFRNKTVNTNDNKAKESYLDNCAKTVQYVCDKTGVKVIKGQIKAILFFCDISQTEYNILVASAQKK